MASKNNNVGNTLMFMVKFLLPLIVSVAGAVIYIDTKAESEAFAAGAAVEKTLTITTEGYARENKKDHRVLKKSLRDISDDVTKINDNVVTVTAKQSAIEANIDNINDRLGELNEHLRHVNAGRTKSLAEVSTDHLPSLSPFVPAKAIVRKSRRLPEYEL